jgi:hypothetical protein
VSEYGRELITTFKIDVRRRNGCVTVNVTDDDETSLTTLYTVAINVDDERDAMRRTLAEAARFLAWYLDPRGLR